MKKHIVSLCLIHVFIALIIFFVHVWCFNMSFYQEQFVKYQVAQEIGVNDADLNKSMKTVLDYLEDKRADITVEVTINGSVETMFNEREMLHMEDVKTLYQNAVKVAYAGVISLLIIIWSIIDDRKKKKYTFIFSLKQGLLIAGFIIAAIGIYAVADFNRFWIQFHQLFFSNDLWLLNPATDNMILMLPEGLFNALVFRIVLSIAGVVVVFAGGLFILERKKVEL